MLTLPEYKHLKIECDRNASFACRAQGILLTAVARGDWKVVYQVAKDFIWLTINSFATDRRFILNHPQAIVLVEVLLLLNYLNEHPKDISVQNKLQRMCISLWGVNAITASGDQTKCA